VPPVGETTKIESPCATSSTVTSSRFPFIDGGKGCVAIAVQAAAKQNAMMAFTDGRNLFPRRTITATTAMTKNTLMSHMGGPGIR